MIPRYSRPEMVALWEPESKFQIWFEIEAHATDALAELGVVPKEAAAAIWAKGKFDVARIDEIEREGMPGKGYRVSGLPKGRHEGHFQRQLRSADA